MVIILGQKKGFINGWSFERVLPKSEVHCIPIFDDILILCSTEKYENELSHLELIFLTHLTAKYLAITFKLPFIFIIHVRGIQLVVGYFYKIIKFRYFSTLLYCCYADFFRLMRHYRTITYEIHINIHAIIS